MMNKRDLKGFASGLCIMGLSALGIVLKDKVAKSVMRLCNEPASYSDAVDAILDSTMFSDSKREALSMVSHDMSSDYYRAIIKVIRSTAFSDEKLKMINIINEKGL